MKTTPWVFTIILSGQELRHEHVVCSQTDFVQLVNYRLYWVSIIIIILSFSRSPNRVPIELTTLLEWATGSSMKHVRLILFLFHGCAALNLKSFFSYFSLFYFADVFYLIWFLIDSVLNNKLLPLSFPGLDFKTLYRTTSCSGSDSPVYSLSSGKLMWYWI